MTHTSTRANSLACSLIILGLSTACIGEDSSEVIDAGSYPDSASHPDTSDFADADDVEDASITPDPWLDLPPRPWSSEQHGPLQIGYRFETLAYTPRGEGEELRELEVSIWYPTFDEDGVDAEYSGFLPREGIWQNAEPAFRQGAPVMIFSHGQQSIGSQSFYWTEFLTSHGWVVVAPEHKYSTLTDTPSDDSLKSGVYRPQDISASIDYLLDLPTTDPLAGLSAEQLAVSGHSFGGFTSLAVTGGRIAVDEVLEDCENGTMSGRYCNFFTESNLETFREGFLDERIRASIPMSPPGANIFRDGLSEVVTPTLLWTADRDGQLTNEKEGDPIWESLKAPTMVRINILDAGHFTLSNLCEFLGSVPDIRDEGCGDDFFDAATVHELNNTYSLEFLRTHLDLEDEPADWFTPDHEPLHPKLIFSFPSP